MSAPPPLPPTILPPSAPPTVTPTETSNANKLKNPGEFEEIGKKVKGELLIAMGWSPSLVR